MLGTGFERRGTSIFQSLVRYLDVGIVFISFLVGRCQAPRIFDRRR